MPRASARSRGASRMPARPLLRVRAASADSGLADPPDRRLVTNRALWHSGRPIRRAGEPRDFGDLGILRTRGARRAERRPRACHRARFVTNLRSTPAEPHPAGSAPILVSNREIPEKRPSCRVMSLFRATLAFPRKPFQRKTPWSRMFANPNMPVGSLQTTHNLATCDS